MQTTSLQQATVDMLKSYFVGIKMNKFTFFYYSLQIKKKLFSVRRIIILPYECTFQCTFLRKQITFQTCIIIVTIIGVICDSTPTALH